MEQHLRAQLDGDPQRNGDHNEGNQQRHKTHFDGNQQCDGTQQQQGGLRSCTEGG